MKPNLTTFTAGFVRNAISNVLSGSQPIENESFVHLHNREFNGEVDDDAVDVEEGWYWPRYSKKYHSMESRIPTF